MSRHKRPRPRDPVQDPDFFQDGIFFIVLTFLETSTDSTSEEEYIPSSPNATAVPQRNSRIVAIGFQTSFHLGSKSDRILQLNPSVGIISESDCESLSRTVSKVFEILGGNSDTLNLKTDASCRCSQNTGVVETGPLSLDNLILWARKHTEKKSVCPYGVFIRQNNSSKARHYRFEQYLDHKDRFTRDWKIVFHGLTYSQWRASENNHQVALDILNPTDQTNQILVPDAINDQPHGRRRRERGNINALESMMPFLTNEKSQDDHSLLDILQEYHNGFSKLLFQARVEAFSSDANMDAFDSECLSIQSALNSSLTELLRLEKRLKEIRKPPSPDLQGFQSPTINF